MHYTRQLHIDSLRNSAFIFGPRMTGKTTLLRSIAFDAYFDLLDPELEMNYKARPALIWEQIKALEPGSTIIVDEIQKIPELLNYIQMAIDRYQHICLLSGSSARKLKREGVNLLGGRALDLRLHPLSCQELGTSFNIETVLSYGSLPKISTLTASGENDLARDFLRSYVSTYIRQEVQAEALTRNIGAFHRFLEVAAQSNGQIIEYANISRECSVPASTVKEYYQILEDTLLGNFLWTHDRNERKKARPKFYFFDGGVIRAIQNRLHDPPTPREKGVLFENWLLGELQRERDYQRKGHVFSYWRKRNHEIDILISDGHGPVLAIECKSGTGKISPATIEAFRKVFPATRLVVASMTDKMPRNVNNIEVLPWKQVIELYRAL